MPSAFQTLSTHKFIGLADGNIIAWFPTLNLLTISMNKMALWVYRLNGERIYSVNNRSPIISICFIQNGRYFCLSGMDDLIKIYDSNNGQLLKVIGKHFNSIKLIDWSYHKASQGSKKLFAVDILGSLPRIAVSNVESSPFTVKDIQESENDTLSYLVIVDSNSVALNFNGLLTIPGIEFPNGNTQYLKHLNNNNVFSQFFLVANDSTLKLVELIIGKGALDSDKNHLIRVITLCCKIISLFDYVGKQLDYLETEVKAFLTLLDRHLSNLNDSIGEFYTGTPESRITLCLFDMIVSNIVPESLVDFWLNQFGERGVKRLSKQGSSMYESIRNTTFTQIIACFEKLLVVSSELESLAQWLRDSENEFDFGLDVESIGKSIDSAKDIFKMFYQMIWDLNEESRLFTKFLLWVKEEVVEKVAKKDDVDTFLLHARKSFHKSSELLEYTNDYLLQSRVLDYFNIELSSSEVVKATSCKFNLPENFKNFCNEVHNEIIKPVKEFVTENSEFSNSFSLNLNDWNLAKTHTNEENNGVICVTKDNEILLINFSYEHPEIFTKLIIKIPHNILLVTYEFTSQHELLLLIKVDNSTYKLESFDLDYGRSTLEIDYDNIPKHKSSLIEKLNKPEYLVVNENYGCILDRDRRNHIIFAL